MKTSQSAIAVFTKQSANTISTATFTYTAFVVVVNMNNYQRLIANCTATVLFCKEGIVLFLSYAIYPLAMIRFLMFSVFDLPCVQRRS